MDIASVILEALRQLRWQDILTAGGVYIATPLVTFIYLQALKRDRFKKDLEPVGDWTMRAIAFISSFVIALFIGWRIGHWPLNTAIDHAFNVGIFYPLAVWLYMARIKKTDMDAYIKIKGMGRRDDDASVLETTWDGKPPK